ncbi:hypothetical protein JHK82_051271 [Glycine max]|uniref:Late embryogenesis abundant protein LEA-2 subgroup domain-containing protein n=2 Tax=Glycine subgen. Soja TaxID=1462606 RepID=A0A0R0FB56_SOYBN|nr:uncharacterized protein LOC100527182 [Glycine max]XP_028212679.1 uncharacterized protein LOC114395168 [Glycine soja]KAG4922300.1 hypothetical protein JHK86_051113 [Glycine max]KAG5092493.1 hypothetical protein JHK82_051271 [Glycine max]KAG5095565.1 hypothetical protein JHK84_051153 [Glycine max]KAH1155574.1 hypothetical protein GYH30_050732 [Glycine max]KHN40590.1 hypothetical protein glysoja_001088 [Glycine soja]|eukprot:NP_001236095.2 uncharacterized protein LOC100527182 [Glycine max]
MSQLAPKQFMTESQSNQDHEQVVVISQKKLKRRRVCVMVTGAVLLLLIVLVIVAIILAFTLFKTKEPRTQLVSATLEGIAPRLTLPAIDLQINVTLDLKVRVENRNRASLKHEGGKSVLLYKGKEVGDAYINPGLIPSRGSTILPCRLTLQVEKLASNLTSLVGDLMGGEISMDTVTRIPGKVTFLGFIKKHIVAESNCQFTISVSELKITNQTCKSKAKL